MKWLDVLSGSERRLTSREFHPEIIVYYWDGSSPEKHCLHDISDAGAFVNTKERWYLGTIVRLTLVIDRGENLDPNEVSELNSVAMFAKVVRHAEDGVGVEFVSPRPQARARLRDFIALASASQPKTSAAAADGGQALVEFALVLPLVLLFIVNAFNFGGYLYAWITIANAARAASQYEVLGGASVGLLSTPTSAEVTNIVTQDVYSLPNKASVTVAVCTNNTTSPVTCGTTPLAADPEAPLYKVACVDVTYTYKPFISLWDFSALGIHATLPATTVHRRAIMRSIQ